MGVARRLYLYGVSALSLAVFAAGMVNLLSAILAEAVHALGVGVIGGSAELPRQQISLGLALVGVGLPIWILHWRLANRRLGADARGSEERLSALRAVHFTVVQFAAVAALLFPAIDLVSRFVALATGLERSWADVTDSVALALVAGPVWLYHFGTRGAEIRRASLSGAASWWTRLYRYVAAFGALAVGLFGASQAIGIGLDLLVGRPELGGSPDWWREPLSRSLAGVIVGLGGWRVHWLDADRVVRDAYLLGEDDRRSRTRAAYVGAVLLLAAANASFVAANATSELVRLALGVAQRGLASTILDGVLGPSIAILPFVIAGLWHVRGRNREAELLGADAPAAARRLTRHLLAGVGLSFLAAGLAQFIALAIDVGANGAAVIDDGALRAEHLASSAALSIVGAAVWFPSWSATLRRRASNELAETASAVSRTYLYLVCASALIAGVPSAAYVLFRAIDAALGAGGSELASSIATPLGIAAVVAAVLGYHGRLLVRDLRRRHQIDLLPGDAAVEDAEPRLVSLVLRVSAEIDLGTVIESVRGALPPGVVIESGDDAGNGAVEGAGYALAPRSASHSS